MKLSFTKEEHEEFIKNHFQIKTAHVIDEENEMYYILPVKEDYTKHDRVIAKTQAEKFGFVFGDGLMVLDYKPIKPTCANYERDNVETETYTITADKYFHQEFKKLVNIDAPILSEMEQNVADYLTTVFPYEKQENIINGLLKHYDYIEVYPVFQRLHYKGKNRIINSECQDPVVESVRQKLLDRSNVGIKKYGKTVDQEVLKPSEWLEHAIQENLDMVIYQTKLKKELEKEEDIKEFTKTIIEILQSDQNEMSVGNKIIREYNKLKENK